MNDRIRSSTYAYILYEEHLKVDQVKSILSDEFNLDYALSPLHTGDDIKPHYHLLLFFPNPVSYNTAVKIGERLEAPKKIMYPANVIAAMRYLVHADDPDKQQFDKSEIYIHGLKAKKVFINAFSDLDMKRVAATFRSIHNYIVNNNIHNINYLQQLLLGTDFEAFQLVNQNYNYFNTLCLSEIRMTLNEDLDLDTNDIKKGQL